LEVKQDLLETLLVSANQLLLHSAQVIQY
jgi:hypothetical protein